MPGGARDTQVSSSPAVAANAEGDEIEVLESIDVLPMAPEDQWKSLFDKYDPENSGFISTERFRDLLEVHGSELDPHKLEVLLALADGNADGKICYQDFVNLMSNKRSNSFRRAILQGGRQLKGAVLREEAGLDLSQRLVRHIAYETLPREIDRKWYFDSYTCCPPPWLILAITITEVAVFLYYSLQLNRWVLQVSDPLFLKGPLPYHPQLRAQAWRYLSYIFMHAGIEHLGLNMAMQLLVGVPLEMVHGAVRIGLVYVCGVLAGSLAVSVADMTAPVVGSSGGVYALVSAHLANVVMVRSLMLLCFSPHGKLQLFRVDLRRIDKILSCGRPLQITQCLWLDSSCSWPLRIILHVRGLRHRKRDGSLCLSSRWDDWNEFCKEPAAIPLGHRQHPVDSRTGRRLSIYVSDFYFLGQSASFL
uniref:rhomboid protease n=1 Tax=Paramormyrops kingsleyae TaxID=1676925 RepID=A0A3B3RRY3_9TELE